MTSIHGNNQSVFASGRKPLVALYRGKSVVSRLIRWQTRSQYSHAALLLPNGSVLESWHRGGVSHNHGLGACHTPGTEVDLFAVESSKGFALVDWARTLDFAFAQIGHTYDYRSVARFLSRRAEKADGKWFCSELVFAAIKAGGLDLLANTSADRVAPGHLAWSPFLRFVETREASLEYPRNEWDEEDLMGRMKEGAFA